MGSKMKRAIITGATGAVGTALINFLIEKNIEILVFCREGSLRNSKIPDHPLITKKYYSLNQLCNIENETGKTYDVFYHFAWEGTTGQARNDMYLQNQNAKYTLDAVHAAEKFGCKKFVGAGSQAEYGRFDGKLSADTPTFPESGYGYAKLCAGQMSRYAAHELGMEHIWVRILSVYGPDDRKDSLIMYTISKLLDNEAPMLTKCEQIWDFLYSYDAANALYLLGEKGVDGKVYVLGNGTARPLNEYINDIQQMVNPKCNINYGAVPYSNNQIMHLQADISELCLDTGFIPKISFCEGIKEILQCNFQINSIDKTDNMAL